MRGKDNWLKGRAKRGNQWTANTFGVKVIVSFTATKLAGLWGLGNAAAEEQIPQ